MAGRKLGTSRTIPLLVTIYLLSFPAYAKYSGGTGEPNDPYQIATAADLIALGETPEDYDKHFILTDDIDLDPNLPGRKVFNRALIAPDTNDVKHGLQGTPFTGVLDGNGHMISHLRITGEDYLGLFGRLGRGGEVKHLGVIGVDITAAGSHVGGLVGHNEFGVVTQCYSTGAVVGDDSVGGLVGKNWYGSVTRCYSTGTVRGWRSAGGLVGSGSAWKVTGSFWDIQTSGRTWSCGGTGKTTAEMQTASTFLEAGWDFVGETANGTEDVWWIDEGKDYPRLWWETK